MKQVLNELWYSNIEPCVNCQPNTIETKDLSTYITRHKDELLNTLNDKQAEIFEKLES